MSKLYKNVEKVGINNKGKVMCVRQMFRLIRKNASAPVFAMFAYLWPAL